MKLWTLRYRIISRTARRIGLRYLRAACDCAEIGVKKVRRWTYVVETKAFVQTLYTALQADIVAAGDMCPAVGPHLDNIGILRGVERRAGELDESYRQRILESCSGN